MLDYLYPSTQRKIFVNRSRELAHIEHAEKQLLAEHPKNISLFGLRRIGKTLLIKESMHRILTRKQTVPVYMNLEEIVSSPDFFVVKYAGYLTYWLNGNGSNPADEYLELTSLISKAGKSGCKSLFDTVLLINTEFGKTFRDHNYLLNLAFNLPEKIAMELDIKMMIFLDEFQVLDILSSSPQVKNPFSLFRNAVQNQNNTAYVVAGSMVSKMEQILLSHKEPLFLQFDTTKLEYFTREDSYELAKKLITTDSGNGISKEILEEIYRHSRGHPFYTTALCERINFYVDEYEHKLNKELVTQAFLFELLSSGGRIHEFCRYMYDISLERARGYGMLKTVLLTLAEHDGLTLSETSQAIGRKPASTSKYLKWLVEVDLIRKKDNRYHFLDPVLCAWVGFTEKGIEIEEVPKKMVLDGLVSKLEEKYLRLSTELGVAKESQIREIMSGFKNQEIARRLFGLDGDTKIRLPEFDTISDYHSADGQIEIDVLAEGPENWAVEIKWKNKAATIKDVKRFFVKMEKIAEDMPKKKVYQLWFISKNGFTKSALGFCGTNAIMTSSKDDVEEIMKRTR